MKKQNFFKAKSFYVICGLILLVFILSIFKSSYFSHAKIPKNVLLYDINNKDDRLYLSDITYNKAQVGWGNIAFDKTQSNTPLTLLLNGYTTVFNKGIWAHATSTVEYDISEYKEYTYFTTYYGINRAANNAGNGVKFYIYTSVDGKNWTLRTEEDPAAMKVNDSARYAKIDIRGANYIRLYAYDNGSNASDNAIWADTKLIKEDYNENVMVPVEEFDEIIKSRYTSGAIKGELVLPILQRDFINRVGQYQLRSFLEEDSKNYETLNWFLHNEEALRLWTIGGTPNGSYQNALKVLSRLYHAYKEDLQNENLTPNGTKYKDLYLKMMLSLSLTHSANVGLWIGGNQLSDAVTRYKIYKEMHLNNKLENNAMFENYTIEEMRGVMLTNIDDEEILWLRDYSSKKSNKYNPYDYMNYTFGYSYYRPQYYSASNYDKWNKKYNLSDYNITYQSGKPKLWIVFEEGAVCGGLSKTAANLYGVWGYPARVVGQPAHAAYVYLYNAGGGKYAWQLAYNVADTGWAKTDSGGRFPNGWGSRYATNSGSLKSGSYLLLSQEAQNEYDKYEQSELILLLESVYRNDRKKLEKIYQDAIDEERINLDAWIGLINLYITDDTKTEADLIELAEEISSVYAYHPLPMYDLTRRIATKITSPEYRSRMMILQNRTLKNATKANSSQTIYHKEVPIIANAILGVVDSRVATFSFTGTDAGKIVLSKQFQSAQVFWSYSLDGGKTWKDVSEHSVKLTDDEIASITTNNDIKIHISGLPWTDANIYTIDITKRAFPANKITINDEEDRMYGVTDDMEWTLDPTKGEWQSFANTNPIFSGNVRVYIRVIATGTELASDPVYYTFKENNVDDTKWYIQSKNLKVVEVNSTQSGEFNNILDGNANTYWRSKENAMPAYVTIELDQPRYISGLDYVPDKSAVKYGIVPYGRAQNVNIYVSLDGVTWELAVSKNNLGDNNNLKHIDFPEAKKAKYVKFECTRSYDAPVQALNVSVIKLYENVVVNETPRAEINYNVVRPTNGNVTAELINPTRDITVTNNGGKKTYTFTENGEFTFKFVDNEGHEGSATAKVDWIDKTPPQLEVSYSTTSTTNQDVVATLKFDKNVTILSKNVEIAENPVDKSKTITFLENDSILLEFMDELGNIGTKLITVDWIDKEAPTAEFEYSTSHITEGSVTVKLVPNETVTILNNGGSNKYTFNENGEFTFDFIDQAGNKGHATAIVSWITKLPKYELKYSTKDLTKEDVIVTVNIEKGYKLINNDGNEYTFKKNGDYKIEYLDSKGNLGAIPVKIDWIDKEPPTAELEYITENNKVIIKIINPSEKITFKEGNGIYEFTKNGEYEIIFYDMVGNEGKITAVINSIKENEDKPDDSNNNNENNNNNPTPPNKPNEDNSENNNKPNNDNSNNKPGQNNSSNNQNNNNTTTNKPNIKIPIKPQKPNNNNKPNTNITYKKYMSGNINIEIPSNAIKEDSNLKVESLKIPQELKDKFEEYSEYYDLYLVNNKSQKINLETTDEIIIYIKLNKEKDFKGVYEITDNNNIKLIDYIKTDENIIIKTDKIGKYILSYKNIKNINKEEKTKSKKGGYVVWPITFTIIISLVISIFVVRSKYKA